MDRDAVKFESCNGTLHVYYEKNEEEDGFHFVRVRIIPFPSPEEDSTNGTNHLITQTDTHINGNTVYKRYNLNNKGSVFLLKGLRIGNQSRSIRLLWLNHIKSIA
ncbi:unnamed protein product [Gordionus sp. m RMFG-2023]